MSRALRIGLFSMLCAFSLSAVWADAIDRLRNGGSISLKIIDGNYAVSGATTANGTLGESDPVVFPLREAGSGTGLDIQFAIRDFFPFIDSDRIATFRATVLGPNKVKWELDLRDLGCVEVQIGDTTANFDITRLWGRLTVNLTNTGCLPDPLGALNRSVSLRMDPTDGSECAAENGNWLKAEGYAFCVRLDPFFTRACIDNIQMVAYGGGLSKELGNVNGDCIIDDADLAQIIFDFGSNNPDSDTNDDGTVDDADLATVIFNFGLEG